MWLALVAVFLLLLGAPAAKAQNTVVASCTATGKSYGLGLVLPGTMDVTGILCTNATGGGGGGGTVTQGPAGPAWNVQGTVFAKLQDSLGNNITSNSNALNVNLAGSGVTLSVQGSGTFTTSDTHLPSTQALSDTLSNPTVTGIGAYTLLWNATNTQWQRALVDNASGGLKVDIVAGAGGGTASTFGAAFPSTGTAAGFKNGSGNMDFAKVDANNNLNIDCGGNPCNATDEGAYTAGTSGYSNIGGVFQTTATNNALTNGEAGAAQLTANRALFVNLRDSGATEAMNTTAHSVKVSPLDSGGGDMTDTTDHALQAVITPTAGSTYAITPVVSSAIESNHVLKASAGNLYGVLVQTGATAGCLMVFNATSAPGDGAVTPAIAPVEVAANSTVGVSFSDVPAAFSTGITAVFSSTCGLTKTASATALFSGQVK